VRVSLRHVSHDYEPSDESAAVHVLDDVSLEIASGDFAVLMGASGSGKSTLLNLIGAVDRPTSGQVFLGEVETSSLDEAGLTDLRRLNLGFIFQFFNLIPTLASSRTSPFLSPWPGVGKRSPSVSPRSAGGWTSSSPESLSNELSGGEMQRVAIGRAVVHRPQLILADEPTGNLDSKTGATILELIREIHDSFAPTVVMATHSDVAAGFGDYVVQVVDGHVMAKAHRFTRTPAHSEKP
jgi:putative ABC transport system ATP-binding protein